MLLYNIMRILVGAIRLVVFLFIIIFRGLGLFIKERAGFRAFSFVAT